MDNIKIINGIIALIVKGNKIVMGKKGHKSGHFLSDAWHFPGGKAEEGETPEQTVVREMKEELGMDIVILKQICAYTSKGADRIVNNVVFLCESDDEPVAGDDLVDAKYFDYDGIIEFHEKQTFENLPIEVKEYLSDF